MGAPKNEREKWFSSSILRFGGDCVMQTGTDTLKTQRTALPNGRPVSIVRPRLTHRR